jgi:hypothetical protein
MCVLCRSDSCVMFGRLAFVQFVAVVFYDWTAGAKYATVAVSFDVCMCRELGKRVRDIAYMCSVL